MEENKKENVFKKIFKKEVIISLVVGLLLGVIVMFFVNDGIEGVVSGKLITKGNLYSKMKESFPIDLVLEDADSKILNKKYDLNDNDLNMLNETANNYIAQYEMYGYTKEEFLKEKGFKSFDEFLEYWELDYKRTMYAYDYLETKLEKNAVKTYYDEKAFGKVNNKHILVKTSDNMTDKQALTIANEIISRLNNGENFETLATEYVTTYKNKVISEDLGKIGAFDNLEETYVNAMKDLEAGKFTTTPVKTSYGYHVIYCVDRTEKTEEISSKDKMAIIDVLIKEAGLTLDQGAYYKALIQMREEAGLKFFDKDFKEKYEEYCVPYVEVEEEHNHSEEQNETEIDISLNTAE